MDVRRWEGQLLGGERREKGEPLIALQDICRQMFIIFNQLHKFIYCNIHSSRPTAGMAESEQPSRKYKLPESQSSLSTTVQSICQTSNPCTFPNSPKSFFQIQQIIDMRIKDTSLVYSYSISVCMGSFVFGYELTSFGNLNDLIVAANTWKDQQEIDQTLLLLSSVLSLAAIFGVGVHRYLIRTFGWVQSFKITDYLTILAAFIGVLNLSVGAQAFSRIIFGVVTGINTILIPTYLTSVLPGAMGGPAGTLNQLFITIGIFFGFWMGYLVVGETSSDMGWRAIVGLPIIPALIRLHTSQNVYAYETVESMIENDQDEALERYVTMMYEEVSVEEFKEAKRLPDIDIEAERATFFDPIAESHKRRLFMASGIVFFNQLSGGAALGNFGANVSFLSVAGEEKEDLLSVFVYLNLVQVLVTLFSGQFLEKYGRRAFMMQGQRVIIVSLLLVAFIEIFVPQLHVFTVILTFIQMVGFSLSYGPCSFLIGTEILHDIFYPSVLLWVFIFVHGISVGSFIQAIGVGPLCLIYCAFQVWGFLYISGYLVETQGRGRRDVYEDFRKGIFPNPIRYLREKLNNNAKHQHRDIELPLVERAAHS